MGGIPGLKILARAFTFICLTLAFFVAPLAIWYGGNRAAVPSHWDPLDPLDLTAPTSPVQRWKIRRALRDGGQCRAAVASAPLTARPRDDVIASESCRLIDTVALRALGEARLTKIDTRCSVALSLFLWERRVVQPAAMRFFGEPVAQILHFGSYSCRRIAGSSRWSQHAHANAVDISGFRLKSGKTISVLKHWSERTDEARFLRAVRSGACDHFTMVLSPDYNEAHRDHFHFDHGWWPGCR